MPTNVNWTRNRKLKRNIPKKEILFWVEQGYARKSKAEGLRMEKIIARCVGATTGSSSSLIRKQSSWPQTLEKKLFAFHLSFFFFFFCLLGAGIPMGAALYIKKLNYWLKIPFGETAIHIKPKYIREYV